MKRDVGRFDRNTGEVLEQEPPFVKAYAEHVTNVKGVTKMQTSVLWFLLSRMSFDNTVIVSSKLRNRFIIEHKTSSNVFSNCVSALAKSGFIDIEGSGQYFVNPDFFTRSDWTNTKKMVAKWTFSKDGVEFEKDIIDEMGEVIVEAEDPEADPVIVKKELRPAPPKAPAYVNFEDFWYIYPKKVGKKTAVKVWMKIQPNKESFQKIADHLASAFKDTKKQFIPNPTTYLNGERWNDEVISNKPIDPFNTEVASFERRCENTFDAFTGNTYDGELN